MDLSIIDSFKSLINEWTLLIFALLAAAHKIASSINNFYEEFIVKRYLKRLNSLTESISKDSKGHKYITALKENEIFRISSGIKTHPEKADMLMDIYLLGIVSAKELKQISEYLRPENDKISINIKLIDKIQFLYSSLAGLLLYFYAIWISVPLYFSGDWSKAISGFIGMISLMTTAIFISKDYRKLRTLKRVKKSLLNYNKIANPDVTFEWRSDFILNKISKIKGKLKKQISRISKDRST